MKSSKATAKHIKQVTSDPQAAQIHLVCHQCTEFHPASFKENRRNITSQGNILASSVTIMKRRPSVHKKYEAHASPDRCQKCGDSQHVEGFRCPASKHQYKNCHKFGQFSSLCYKKKEFEHKRETSPRAHQMKIGTAYMQEELCGQSEESSSDDLFCLQARLKSTQAETQAPQHLITNLTYKLKPHKKTHYLRAR